MQFHVPQFIDVEDKLFGPFTFRQFVYMVGGLGLSYLVYKFFGIVIAIFLVPAILGLSAALTFVKINNKPFIQILESWFKFTINKKLYGRNLYIWRKDPPKKATRFSSKATPPPVEPSYIPRLSDSKLKDISWGLDVLDVNKK
jgi:hypothetical protein